MIVAVYYSNKLSGLDINIFVKQVLLPTFVVTLVVTVFTYFSTNIASEFVGLIIVFLTSFVVSVWAIGFIGLNNSEKNIVINGVKGLKKILKK
jgi:hypothetical protein